MSELTYQSPPGYYPGNPRKVRWYVVFGADLGRYGPTALVGCETGSYGEPHPEGGFDTLDAARTWRHARAVFKRNHEFNYVILECNVHDMTHYRKV